jgi:hypothetical protein
MAGGRYQEVRRKSVTGRKAYDEQRECDEPEERERVRERERRERERGERTNKTNKKEV